MAWNCVNMYGCALPAVCSGGIHCTPIASGDDAYETRSCSVAPAAAAAASVTVSGAPSASVASPSANAPASPTDVTPPVPSSDPTPSATTTPPPKPAPKPTPNRDRTFTVAFKVQGKTHTYWYGPEDADRSKRARTKLVANGLWSEFRTQAMMYDAPFDPETRLLVAQSMDANQDLHLTLDELTVGRRAGLLGLLGG